MNLEPEPGVESENNVIATELAQTIKSLNLSINQSELEGFVHIDDKKQWRICCNSVGRRRRAVGIDED